MLQNGQTELRKSVYRFFESYPKAYIDTLRVKFVRSKKAQNEEKSHSCDFSTLFYNIEFVTLPNPLIYLPFCGLDFFYISFVLVYQRFFGITEAVSEMKFKIVYFFNS